MDRFKEDMGRIKEIEDSITGNLKERAKAAKAGQPTTKVGLTLTQLLPLLFTKTHSLNNV